MGTTPDHLIKLLDSSPSAAAMYVRRAGEVIAEIHTLRLLNLRRATRAIAGAEPGPEGNVTKLLVAESGQHLTELAFELAGTAAVVEQTPQLTRSYLGNRAMTIAGGTSEITRNTIAERILGLPRDPLLRRDSVVHGFFHVATNFLDLWARRDFGASLAALIHRGWSEGLAGVV